MSRAELIRTAREILAASPFAETEVGLTSDESRLTRFGDNRITQNVSSRKAVVRIRAIERRGELARTACVESDQLDRDSIARAYDRLGRVLGVLPWAEEVAGLAKGDGELPERDLPKAPDPETAAAGIGRAAAVAAADGFQASGAYSTDRQHHVLVNSAGLVAADQLSEAEFACTVEGRGGAGRGFAQRFDPRDIDVAAVIERAAGKCRLSAGNARAIEPGPCDVVLEPAALAELLVYFGWTALSGKAYLEERSFCKGRLGDRILGEQVTIIDDPLDERVRGSRFDGVGVPKRRLTLVDHGVLTELATDVKTAAVLGRAPTGHGYPEPSSDDPVPWNIGLEWGGTRVRDVNALVSRVKRGVLVTQFHYTNVVDVMVPSVTGMTRNGTFLIEDGRITAPVRNMRFTQSLVEVFDRIEAVTESQERVSTFFGGASLAPAALVRGFHFSSGTEF